MALNPWEIRPRDTRSARHCSRSVLPRPPLSLLASTPNPAIRSAPRMPETHVYAKWNSVITGLGVGSQASATIFDRYRALSLVVSFVPSLMPGTSRSKVYHSNPPISRIPKHSRIKKRLYASGIHPFASRCRYPATHGSAAPPRHRSSHQVRRLSPTSDSHSVCIVYAYSPRNLTFCQKLVSLRFHPSGSPYPIENASSTCARTRANDSWSPIDHICSPSLTTAPPPNPQESPDSNTSVRFPPPRVSDLRRLEPPASWGGCFVPGFAAILEKSSFSWQGTFCRVFVYCPTLVPSIRHSFLFSKYMSVGH